MHRTVRTVKTRGIQEKSNEVGAAAGETGKQCGPVTFEWSPASGVNLAN